MRVRAVALSVCLVIGAVLISETIPVQAASPAAASSVQAPSSASWITSPAAATPALATPAAPARAGAAPAPANAAVSLQFRRRLELPSRPRQFRVRVSADSRFILYVNGQRVGQGPARGDLEHWRYERFDLAPYLNKGENIVAAQVWNDAGNSPIAQVSARTAFMLAPDDANAASLDTASGWQVRIDASRTSTSSRGQLAGGYYAAGAPEVFDGSRRDWSWNTLASAATDWQPAVATVPTGAAPWTLIPDPLPAMRYEVRPIGKLVRTQGMTPPAFPDRPLTIPANTTVSLLLDAGLVQAAYPELTLSGGKGAEVTMRYTEALYDATGRRFTDRAQIGDGQVLGIFDTIHPDGGAKRTYEPYWWRVWRFLEVKVKTGDQPLTLEGLKRYQTGYPFQLKGRFASSDPELDRIWQIGWNTAQADAHETYQDSSYWEQLQYIGDTRLQMLITYALTADPRLPVQALDAIQDSRINGLPRSAYPSRNQQSIPPFTLIGIGSLHDFWMHEPDLAPIKRNLDGMRTTLDWYKAIMHDGLVGPSPGWQFVDWRPGLSEMPRAGGPPAPDSCIITLLYIGALKEAADIENAVGEPSRATADLAAAEASSQAVRTRCWDAGKGLFATTPEKTAFTQHANILAVLYDVVPKSEQQALLDKVTVRGHGIDAPTGITGTSYYFSYYLAQALDHAGLGDRYPEMLQTWRDMLAKNFTTWPEQEDPTRSDGHAWSAHPTEGMLAIMAGVQPASPGFRTVQITPHLGSLTRLDATVAHPNGQIDVSYRLAGGKLQATITLPKALAGSFSWGGKTVALKPGKNAVSLTR
ncbi:MAG: hypothetical protein JWM33_1856 [Caulobacteraceae bacterium]|nr:hypothetical protein [Caulobacteraceae bacterium]